MARVLVCCLALSIAGCGGCGSKAREDGLHEIDARVNVKAAVEARLKDPGSASFPWSMDFKMINDDTWSVSSYVDAKNSFGGMVRTNFTATVGSLGSVKSLNISN